MNLFIISKFQSLAFCFTVEQGWGTDRVKKYSEKRDEIIYVTHNEVKNYLLISNILNTIEIVLFYFIYDLTTNLCFLHIRVFIIKSNNQFTS